MSADSSSPNVWSSDSTTLALPTVPSVPTTASIVTVPWIFARIAAIDEFVKAGGTLVCFNRASTFAIDQLHLPVRNAIAGVNRTQFFVGGSLLNVITTPAHRVMAGMPEQAAVFYDSGPVFETQDGFKGTVLARYADTGSPLASGFLLGEKYLLAKAAALDV